MDCGVNADVDQAALARVFGEDSTGATPEVRACTSAREFVRGQTMLAEASERATGRRLSAFEALKVFGFETLRRAVEDGQVAIVPDRGEPARTLAARRAALGLTVERLARLAGLRPAEVVQAETAGKVSPIRTLERLAPPLAVDERFLGSASARSADPELGVRFRRLSNPETGEPSLSPTAVVKLAEAAWVIARQEDLLTEIDKEPPPARAFRRDPDYRFPAYQAGYRLAARTRQLLDIAPDAPIPSLRRIIEDVLRIPVVETELGQALAGATIANGAHRGIVVNVEGRNQNPWVRRMTLAHELGHLLWDPAQKLESLMVDRYAEIEGDPRRAQDPVEVRANAFAIALLAPPEEVDRIVRRHNGDWDAVVSISERFGISVTASKAHVQNVCRYRVAPGRRMPVISDEWKAQENYTNDYFPIRTTPVARRGRFAWAVVRSMERRLISLDTAATLLATDPDTLSARASDVLQLTGLDQAGLRTPA